MEEISLRFNGKEASQGRLHFYEYSRSQYATARFLSTVEHFRRSGRVPPRVTRSTYVDVFVETPKDGSFLEVLLIKSQEAAASAISAPLTSLIALVWNTILPRDQRAETDLLEMAKIQRDEEIERTRQSEQETERLRELRLIIETENATTQQALALADNALKSSNPAYGQSDLLGARIEEIRQELLRENERSLQTRDHADELEKIDAEQLAKLTSKLRPMLTEMALPLKKSADTLQIESGKDQKPLLLLNPRNVAELDEKVLDDVTVELEVHVRSYDRDRGVGKVSSPELTRQLNFVVPPSKQLRLLPDVLDAMAKDTVVFSCRMYRDKSGLPSSLLLQDIL